MKIKLIKPSGFCFGVERAIKMLDDLIENSDGKKIYCFHEIVHNPKVVDYFKSKGVVFINDIDSIVDKENSILAFSAHGVNKFFLQDVAKYFYKVVNLECPLVTKVYDEAKKFIKKGRTIFYIGKKGHQEAEQVISFIKDLGGNFFIFLTEDEIPLIDRNTKIGILTQTTLNFNYVNSMIKKIKSIYPFADSINNSDICKATFDRQNALRQALPEIDLLIVIGGKNSSNTKELVKIGQSSGKEVIFVEKADDIESFKSKIKKFSSVGITAGASTPPDEIYKAREILIS